jgi:hypothetical protein
MAQSQTQDHVWSRGTSISGFAGAAADGSQRGPAFGGSVGWELTPRFALEGSGEWAEFGGGSRAFAGAFQARTALHPSGRVGPFLHGGIGLYRASFDGRSGAPGFYARRMAAATHRPAAFTDPSIVFGGGLDVSLNRTLKLRPDVQVAIVMRDSRSHAVSSFRLHLVYVFEDHPVTPSRR